MSVGCDDNFVTFDLLLAASSADSVLFTVDTLEYLRAKALAPPTLKLDEPDFAEPTDVVAATAAMADAAMADATPPPALER